MEPITTKTKFIELYLAGVLGNRFRVWTNVNDALDANVPVGFREINLSGGGKFEMCNSRQEIIDCAKRWDKENRKYYLNEGNYFVQSLATIQGEICRTEKGWSLYYGPANEYKMRDMFARNLAVQVFGYKARRIMYHYMDADTIEDINDIFELYPDHVIEFTSHKINVGILPRRNTIIWEVRKY